MIRSMPTTYFEGEGRPAMADCIRRAFEWCVSEGIAKLVVFTGTGDGPRFAAKELLTKDEYQHLRVVAVTPPVGRPYRADPADPKSVLVYAGIQQDMREELEALGINVVSAHLPFKGIHDGHTRASEWSRVAEAYGVLGGGFALAVQAAMMACDAGIVDNGERVVSVTADTALVALACRTDSFLSPVDGFLVEHIICRPLRYSISKREHLARFQWNVAPTAEAGAIPLLPSASAEAPSPVEQIAPPPERSRTVKRPKATKRPTAKRHK